MATCVRRRGWTLIEVLLTLFVLFLAVIGVLVFVALRDARRSAWQLQESTQLRGIYQGMVLWAQSNQDDFPQPSLVDRAGGTLAAPEGQHARKDATRHLWSLLVYNGFFPVEMLVSAAEANPAIRVWEGYQFDRPDAAADPAKALWDPAFQALPRGAAPGNAGDGDERIGPRDVTTGSSSYAHVPMFGPRFARNLADIPPTSAVLGNRGPDWTLDERRGQRRWRLAPGAAGERSRTLLIHGRART